MYSLFLTTPSPNKHAISVILMRKLRLFSNWTHCRVFMFSLVELSFLFILCFLPISWESILWWAILCKAESLLCTQITVQPQSTSASKWEQESWKRNESTNIYYYYCFKGELLWLIIYICDNILVTRIQSCENSCTIQLVHGNITLFICLGFPFIVRIFS